MKKLRTLLGIAFILGSTTLQAPAHGCGFGFYLGIPFLFGLGFGLGAQCANPYYYPGYYCGVPADGHAQTATAPSAPSDMSMSAPPSALARGADWVPSTPAPGHWIQDPNPYQYAPGRSSPPASVVTVSAPNLTVTHSPAGVPIFVMYQPQR
jgi:hypothetical protein